MKNASYSKLSNMSKELKNAIEIVQVLFELWINEKSQNVVWINNSRTAWPTLILVLFLSSLGNRL